MMELVTVPAEILHQPSGVVEDLDMAHDLALDMIRFAATLREPESVGLSACQIGIPAAMFVWRESGYSKHWMAAANPVLEIADKKLLRLEEGCLSLPGKWNVKPRARAVTMRFYDLFLGADRELTALDFHARVLQHETDHLAGKLFIDRAPKGTVTHAKSPHAKKRKKKAKRR